MYATTNQYCPNCGYTFPDTELYCPYCGAPNTATDRTPTASPYYSGAYSSYYSTGTHTDPYYSAPSETYCYTAPPKASAPSPVCGILSMVFGIIAAVFSFIGLLTFSSVSTATTFLIYSLAFGIPGIVLGSIARRRADSAGTSDGRAVAGSICSIVSLGIFSIVFFFAALAF